MTAMGASSLSGAHLTRYGHSMMTEQQTPPAKKIQAIDVSGRPAINGTCSVQEIISVSYYEEHNTLSIILQTGRMEIWERCAWAYFCMPNSECSRDSGRELPFGIHTDQAALSNH